MKKILLNFLLLLPVTLFSQVTTNPSPIEVDQPVTITVDITAGTCNSISNPAKVYMHAGIGPDSNPWNKVKGNWGMDDGVGEMTNDGDGLWSITITPNTYFSLTAGEEASATKMGMVFRNEDGSQKLDHDTGSGCEDFFLNVGAFQVTMINPSPNANGVIIVNSGGGTQILAQNTNGPADYELFANGVSIHSQNSTTFYNGYLFSGLTENQHCDLVVTQGGSSITKSFVILVNSAPAQNMAGGLVDGINYDSGDNTKATLVLNAPLKDFVYLAGSFPGNDWEPKAIHAMKKDASGKFWFELTGLTPGTYYTYQYWVGALSPVADSPKLVKTADPFSTLVLSPFDDPGNPNLDPGLPSYPSGQEREVTVLQTGQTPYSWTSFTKPKKEDLIIYEVLVRDFDANRNFQDLIDRIDYFKNLNINAIELMPVMEFEGNESWGYNSAFHMALDKSYGTEDKFKELIDLYHQNGIAVILDLALNHVYGRSPMVRMWMNDPDGDGWGTDGDDETGDSSMSTENPYLNQYETHAYSVGNDFDHSSTLTQYYTQRVIKHWIEEFNIDGFRWDLTKGFTQNCSPGNEFCTNSFQQDRVDILIDYADYSWSLDPDHYVIFEHLGTPDGSDDEEIIWANYRLGEGKGIMMWSEMWDKYKQLGLGYSDDISRMGHIAHGFTGKRSLGYPESHDKDRIMYEMLQYGNAGSGFDLNTALKRMSTIGAISIPIPGPKMIWHFGELGMDNSIWTCFDGSVDVGNDYCKLDTKPQPQWESAENWPADPNRSAIYDDWSRLIDLKINEDVFEGNYSITTNTLTPKIYIWDDTLPNLKNVVILANFNVTAQNVTPNFPYTGDWYDLMDESGNTYINVGSTITPINIPAGGFKIYGNKASTLSIEDITQEMFALYPNPASDSFQITKPVDNVSVYDIAGKLIQAFKGDFPARHEFDVSKISQGLYIVKFDYLSTTVTKQLIIN